MDFMERNEFLAEAWQLHLTSEEREQYNARARTECIHPPKKQIKRGLRRIKAEVC